MPARPIGRSAELAAAAGVLDAMAAGPAGLLVEGDAGIGKTTVWRATVTAAADRGYQVLVATAVDDESDLPFVALRDLFDDVPATAAEALPAVQREALDTALLRSAQTVEAADHLAVSAAVLGVVRALAAQRPLVLAVDDVPWLDRASERVLRYVIRRLSGEPAGILAARRSVAGQDVPLAMSTLPLLHRLELGPMDADTLHALLAAQDGAPLPRRVTRRIHALSSGNPFHAGQLARVARRDGPSAVSGPAPALPVRIEGGSMERLAALAPPARRTLAVVAEAPACTVAMVTGVLGDEAAAGLADAVDDGLLEIHGGRVRFVHPLLRSAVASVTTGAERRAVHRRLAEVVVDEDQRATHLAAGASEPDEAVALALERAAHRAYLRGAPDAAADLAGRSVALTPAASRSTALRRTIAAAEYDYRVEDLVSAQARLDEAIGELPAGGLRAEALLWRGTVAHNQGRTVEASRLLRQAAGEAGDPHIRSAAQRHLALSLLRSGELAAADRSAAAALATAQADGDEAAVAESRGMLAWTQFWTGHGLRADLLEATTRPWTRYAAHEVRPGLFGARMLSWAGQLDAARAVLEPEVRDARDSGADRALALLLFNLGELECWSGHYERASEVLADGMRAAVLTGSEIARCMLLSARGLLCAHLGQLDEARAYATEGFAASEAIGAAAGRLFNMAVLGFADLSAGDPGRVRDLLLPVPAALPAGRIDLSQVRFVPDLVEALVALGELERAEQVLAPFEQQAIRLDRPWGLVGAGRARALLAIARGDLAAAERAAGAALAACARLPMPFEHARTGLVVGTVQRRSRRRRDARKSLDAALAEFERLGTPLWATRARDELHRIGGRAAGPDVLTEAERRIVELVVAGRTNKEVAATLYLAVSTVEAALWKVYRKLGVRSRTELAARMAAADTPAGGP